MIIFLSSDFLCWVEVGERVATNSNLPEQQSFSVACTENKVKYFTLQNIFFVVSYTQSIHRARVHESI